MFATHLVWGYACAIHASSPPLRHPPDSRTSRTARSCSNYTTAGVRVATAVVSSVPAFRARMDI